MQEDLRGVFVSLNFVIFGIILTIICTTSTS